MQLKNKNHPR